MWRNLEDGRELFIVEEVAVRLFCFYLFFLDFVKPFFITDFCKRIILFIGDISTIYTGRREKIYIPYLGCLLLLFRKMRISVFNGSIFCVVGYSINFHLSAEIKFTPPILSMWFGSQMTKHFRVHSICLCNFCVHRCGNKWEQGENLNQY